MANLIFGLCFALGRALVHADNVGPGPLGPSLGPIRDSTLGLSDVVWQPETSGFFVGSPSIVVVRQVCVCTRGQMIADK